MPISTSSSPSGAIDPAQYPAAPAEVSASPEVSASLDEEQSRGNSSDDSDRGRPKATMTRPKRPPFLTRKSSGTIIIPRTAPTTSEVEEYPPDDARAMSPRRDSVETEKLEEATRTAIREHARQVQLNLLEIAESIELVKADHDKLEKQNLALQDYIGGLTRSMSKNQMKGTKGKKK